MTPITRNPDINIDSETVPLGCYIHHGKQLMNTARSAKVPFGLATKRTYVPGTSHSRIETVGLVIRIVDRLRFDGALKIRDEKKKYSRKYA